MSASVEYKKIMSLTIVNHPERHKTNLQVLTSMAEAVGLAGSAWLLKVLNLPFLAFWSCQADDKSPWDS